MFRTIFLSVFGFGLGLFMLLNSAVVFSKLVKGDAWNVTPEQKLVSAVVTCLVGIVLILWTYLLLKKSKSQ